MSMHMMLCSNFSASNTRGVTLAYLLRWPSFRRPSLSIVRSSTYVDSFFRFSSFVFGNPSRAGVAVFEGLKTVSRTLVILLPFLGVAAEAAAIRS
jgi:hypothetical protein